MVRCLLNLCHSETGLLSVFSGLSSSSLSLCASQHYSYSVHVFHSKHRKYKFQETCQ